MSRRPSVVSFNAATPTLGNGQIKTMQPSTRPAPPSRKSSLSNFNDTSEIDPDELFTKYTVSEVKFVQQRLRADADAKQEELRLMVGERYRDLLQASTSIISIAGSSKRVLEALQDTKYAILAQEEPPLPRRTSVQGSDDTHLQALQLLSAHMKLLLDAPEHLWRLIERKRYFTAAWLFLLARVVHRALVRDDEQDEETWSSQGLNVSEQFPLVQRQWEAVSQFRSQIIHKATLSLREYSAPPEDTCATLLTLHLLDSRPLTETLSVLLGQRTRTLHTLFFWGTDNAPHTPISAKGSNGHVPEKSALPAEVRQTPLREVRVASQAALDALSQTVQTARKVFDGDHHSMIGQVLQAIQSDSPNLTGNSQMRTSELELSTEKLLMALPSSTHFLLLPPNLRSYKPYVDLDSSSAVVQQNHFVQTLDEWFQKSSKGLKAALERWFLQLHSVKEVWSVRSSVREWINLSSGLKDNEMDHLKQIFDDVSGKRVIAIWQVLLSDAENAFKTQLDSAVASLDGGSEILPTDVSPVDFLFQAPPLPVVSQTGSGVIDSSSQKYKASLRRQLMGRTPLLDAVLSTLENCANILQQDISHVLAGEGGDTRALVDRLREVYQPDAETLCSRVVETLRSAGKADAEKSPSAMSSLVFVGRIADELASSSTFVSDIGCGEVTVESVRKKTKALHELIIDRWRTYTVARIMREHEPAFSLPTPLHFTPSAPSSGLLQSLLSLSHSIQQLGVSRDPSRQNDLTDKILRSFITSMVSNGWDRDDIQTSCDLAFLYKFADLRGTSWVDVCELLTSRDRRIREKYQSEGKTTLDEQKWTDSANEYFARTQVIFAPLLPHPPPARLPVDASDKFAALLPYGSPPVDQHFHSAVELAKPTSRFGLLLIDSGAIVST